MIRQHIIYKRFLLVTLAVGVVLTSRFFVDYKITSQYQDLINTDEITKAFLENDSKAIRSISVQYGLEYQQVQHGNIVSSTSPDLPALSIIPMDIAFAKGTLMESPRESLATLAPLSFYRRGRVYAGATLFPNDLDSPGYIVYTQVLP